MLNLLSNAIKFSPTHDVVKVIVKAEKFDPTSVNVSITVVDFGIGINE